MAINRHAVEVGVLTAVGNYLIFAHMLPPIADVRRADAMDQDVSTAEKQAIILATGWTILVSTLVQSWETFIVAGAAAVGVDFAYKHAIAVTPETGKIRDSSMMSLDGGTSHP